MWIAANTNVRLLSGVPLDTTNDHTIYFSTMSNQYNYFVSRTKYNLSNYVYQRYTKGSIRVQKKCDDLYDCNYIMFQNSSFGNKWFYGFITDITYVNNDVSEITYEIDDIQTWWFDFTVDDCWIDREHSATDNIGDNIIPENIETGEIMHTLATGHTDTNYNLLAITSVDETMQPSSGGMINNVYSGLKFLETTGPQALNDYLEALTNQAKSEAVLSIIMVPQWMSDSATGIGTYFLTVSRPNNIDGYIPKNKKLLTGQFCFITVSNYNGGLSKYDYEYFSNPNVCRFDVMGTYVSGNPESFIYPKNYKGLTDNLDEKMLGSSYPSCAYTVDAYRAWLAQTKAERLVSYGNIALKGVVNAVANPIGLLDTLGQAANAAAQAYDKSLMPPQSKGNTTEMGMVPYGAQGFYIYNSHISQDFARIADNFFTRFGYKTNRLKKPNMNVRENFCYTKTIGCTITGDIPGDAARNICNIYNTGITFWKNPAVIGDYTVSNNPV